MCLAWMTKRTYRTRKLDEEDGAAPWPRISNGSTNSSEAKGKPQASKVSTNGSVTKLREGVRKARGEDQRLDEELGGKQYEPVAWRSAPHRAARTNREGRVEHDAGPVAALPILLAELHAHHHFTPLAPRYGNI